MESAAPTPSQPGAGDSSTPDDSATSVSTPEPTPEAPEPKDDGDTCGQPSECDSGFCVDGVCCDAACDGVCSRCDAAGDLGHCSATASDSACPDLACPDNSECRTFQGNNLDENCESVGECRDEADCDTSDAQQGTSCSRGMGQCDGSGQCVVQGKKELGVDCSADDECGSNHCAESTSGAKTCCDAACDGVCRVCSDDGHCDTKPADDDACNVSCPSDTQCMDYPAAPTQNRCAALGQCVQSEAVCGGEPEDEGATCGDDRICDGNGDCVNCPNTSGASRTCTEECPCDSGEGKCYGDAQCASDLACVPGGGIKYGFDGATCLPPTCDNNIQDGAETSIDCGGDCGCLGKFIVMEWPIAATNVNFNDMSGDGSVVVGAFSDGGFFPAAWDANGSLQLLSTISGTAYGTSQDGSVIVGSRRCTATSAGNCNYGTVFGSGDGTTNTDALAYRAVSDSGQVIAGQDQDYTGFIRKNGSVTTLPSVSDVKAMSRDGKVLAVLLKDGGGLNLYTESGFAGLSVPSGWNASEVQALDGDGSVVVISAKSASDSRISATVIWNRSSVGALMPTPSGASGAAAFDVDAAGDTFVGTRLGSPNQAILFELPSTFTLVTDALEARGVELPPGVVLSSANEVSSDGNSIVGLGKTQSGANMVWRAELN